MMTISVTTLRKRFDYYIDLAQKENIYVTRYGKVIALLTHPTNSNKNIRLGVAKDEMKGFDISLEDLNSIPIDEFDGDND